MIWLVMVGSLAAMVSAMSCGLVLKMARRMRWVGKPVRWPRDAESAISPLGGIGLAGACLMVFLLCSAVLTITTDAAPVRAWLIGGVWMLGVGLVDDVWQELSPVLKLVTQTIGAICLLSGGVGVHIASWPLWLNAFLTVIWVVGMTNAMNLLDILDGLAATIGAISGAALAIVCVWSGQILWAGLGAALVGALAGFFVWNRPPARLYMGDAGSQWLGFSLAALALAIHYAPPGHVVALATPLVILGLPIYDLVFVTWMRVRQGRSPLRKSQDHFALRLALEGRAASETLVIMAGLAGAYAVAGLFVARAPNAVGLLVILMAVAVTLCWGRRVAAVPINA